MREAGGRGNERGVALILALFTLVVMSALVAGSFVAGRLEYQSARNTLFANQSAEAAEAGLADALITIAAGSLAAPPVGATSDLDTLNFAAGFRVERRMSRLTSTLVLIRSAGSRVDADGAALAVRAVGALMRLTTDSLSGTPRMTPLDQRGWAQLR